jgi:hypothetical protein
MPIRRSSDFVIVILQLSASKGTSATNILDERNECIPGSDFPSDLVPLALFLRTLCATP